MKRILFLSIVLGLIVVPAGSAFAQNKVGEGINTVAKVPGKAVQGAGTVVKKGGEAVPVVGKPVEGAGMVINKGGEVVEGVADSATGAPISKEARAELAAPVNCKTAKADIAFLEEEHRGGLGRLKSGVQSVAPAAAAVKLIGGNYRNGVKVATGKYNKDLEAKITQIKRTCHL